MRKKIIIFIAVLIIFMFGLFFLKTNRSLAQICGGAVPAQDCSVTPGVGYCSDPCNENNLTGAFLEPAGMFCLCPIITPKTIPELVTAVTNFILMVAIFVYPLMVIIAAFFLITAGGNPENIKKAKSILIYSSLGFGIIMFANALVYVIKNVLGTI
jgi:hypothetical protein